MSFKGYLCQITGEQVPVEECIACALRGGLPGCEFTPAILHGIASHQRPADFSTSQAATAWGNNSLDMAFSVTELLGCARKAHLTKVTDWWETPAKLYFAYRGTLFHSEAEKYAGAEPKVTSEQRLFWFFQTEGKKIALSGQPDLLVYRDGGWYIVDYKTIKEVPGKVYRYTCPATGETIYEVPFRVKGKNVNCRTCGTTHPIEDVPVEELPPQPRGTHVEQIQFYALLIEKNEQKLREALNTRLEALGYEKLIPNAVPVIGAELSYMDMSGPKRLPVEIWPREERVALLKNKLAKHNIPEGVLPPPLENANDLWQCNYCPVRTACEAAHGAPVGK